MTGSFESSLQFALKIYWFQADTTHIVHNMYIMYLYNPLCAATLAPTKVVLSGPVVACDTNE